MKYEPTRQFFVTAIQRRAKKILARLEYRATAADIEVLITAQLSRMYRHVAF